MEAEDVDRVIALVGSFPGDKRQQVSAALDHLAASEEEVEDAESLLRLLAEMIEVGEVQEITEVPVVLGQ